MTTKLLNILLVLPLCLAIHYQAIAPEDQNTQYYEALAEKETKLLSALNRLQQKIEFLNTTLTQLKGMPDQQVIALREAIAGERAIVEEVQGNFSIPLSFKTLNCKNFTAQQSKQLNDSIQMVEQELNAIKAQLDQIKEPTQSSCPQLIARYNSTQLYLNKLKQILGQACPPEAKPPLTPNNSSSNGSIPLVTNTSSYMNLTNLNGTKYVFGSMTPLQYLMRLFNESTSNNLTKCSLQTPVVLNGTTNCSKCPVSKPIFDLSISQCINCPTGYTYDPDNHRCLSGMNCQNGKIFDSIINQCVCPTSQPYVTANGTCVECYFPKYFNEEAKSCQYCPQGHIYNRQQSKCEACPSQLPLVVDNQCKASCPAGTTYDADQHKCLRSGTCPSGQIQDPLTLQCSCPPDTHINGSVCVSCQQSEYWEQASNSCQQCPAKTKPNPSSDGCQPEQTQNNNCPDTYVFSPSLQKCVCPESSPFTDGKSCYSCPLPKYWDQSTNQCRNCTLGQYYNIINGRCQSCPQSAPLFQGEKCVACPFGTKFNSTAQLCQETVYVQNCSSNYVYSISLGHCSCPDSNPFDDGSKCVTCYYPKYWNYQTRQCLLCGQNQYFSIQELQCKYCPIQTPIFSFQSLKCEPCSQGTSFNSYTRQCQPSNNPRVVCPEGSKYNSSSLKCQKVMFTCPSNLILNQSTNLCNCPSSLPYYDGNDCRSCDSHAYFNSQTGACEQCPEQKPLYNNKTSSCQACPYGKKFNPNTLTCTQNSAPVTPLNPENPQNQANTSYACPPGTVADHSTHTCKPTTQKPTCPQDSTYDANTQKCVFSTITCPQGSTYDANTQKCVFSTITCPQGSVYDATTQKCVFYKITCPQGSTYDAESHKCVFNSTICPPGTVYDAANHLCIASTITCPNGQEYLETEDKCTCPESTPFYSGTECVSCPSNTYFNMNTQKCESCPQGSAYDATSGRCYPTSFGNCKETYTWNHSQGLCVCPAETPFDDGTRCVSCYLPKYWDYDKRACLDCPEGLHFGLVTRVCQKCPQGKTYDQDEYRCV